MTVPLRAAFGVAATGIVLGAASAQSPSKTLDQAHKGLSSGPLRYARLTTLPKGVLLRSGKTSITQAQLAAEIAKLNPQARSQIKGHEIVVLENMAVTALLRTEAQQWAARTKSEAAGKDDDRLINAYLQSVASAVTVTDAELKAFYNGNKEMFGGAPFDAVANELRSYLAQTKRREAVMKHISDLGKRNSIEVDTAWSAAQARTVLNNPVDRVRRSGKPALVKFGSKGCAPCDMLAPILEELKKTYAGKCEVLDIQVREQPMVATRYGIESIPVQIFFDKNGDEVYRHTGFWPKDKLVAKLAEMGIK